MQGQDTTPEQIAKMYTRSNFSDVMQGVFNATDADELQDLIPDFEKMDRIDRMHYTMDLRDYIEDKRKHLSALELEKLNADKKHSKKNLKRQSNSKKNMRQKRKETNPPQQNNPFLAMRNRAITYKNKSEANVIVMLWHGHGEKLAGQGLDKNALSLSITYSALTVMSKKHN